MRINTEWSSKITPCVGGLEIHGLPCLMELNRDILSYIPPSFTPHVPWDQGMHIYTGIHMNLVVRSDDGNKIGENQNAHTPKSM